MDEATDAPKKLRKKKKKTEGATGEDAAKGEEGTGGAVGAAGVAGAAEGESEAEAVVPVEDGKKSAIGESREGVQFNILKELFNIITDRVYLSIELKTQHSISS